MAMTAAQALRQGSDDKMREDGCPVCGAAVESPAKHREWHAEIQGAIVDAAKSPSAGQIDLGGMR